MNSGAPAVGIVMGSQSDWETMRHAAETLARLGVAHEVRIVSAHRTPKRLYGYADSARGRGLKVVIAGAGGAAHLPGKIGRAHGRVKVCQHVLISAFAASLKQENITKHNQ